MVLTKDELLAALQYEVRLILHLASKVIPEQADYRPSAQQRSTIELLRYLTVMAPVQTRVVRSDKHDNASFGAEWTPAEEASKNLTLAEAVAKLEALPALFTEQIGSCTDEELRVPINMFGIEGTRG